MTGKPSTAQIDAAASDWLLRRDAGLTEAERAEFDRWLAADLRHRAAIARAEQTWALLDRPQQTGRGLEMVQALGRRATRRRRRRVLTAALAMAAVVVIGVQWRSARIPSSDLSTAVVTVPETRVLPDGGTIELRPGARLSVDYSGVQRRIALESGEALFHVAANKQRPFIVSARNVHVRAVGTAFVVSMQTGQVDVVVTHGTVAVERSTGPQAADGPTAPVPVEAGHRITVGLAPGAPMPPVVALSADEMARRLDWLAPTVKFSDTPLAEAVALINRHSRVQFVIDDPALARMPANGVLRVDNPETLIAFFENGFNVQTQRSGDTIILRRAR